MGKTAIVSAVRTPFTRALKGAFKDTRPDRLAAVAIRASLERAGHVEAREVEDVVLGCAMPEGEQGMNIARIASLTAGLPDETSAFTVNRFCASGLQSIAIVADRIRAGAMDVGIAGGVESMSMIPMGGNKMSLSPELVDKRPEIYMPMGLTAENISQRFDISRTDQDEFALLSHRRAIEAQRTGRLTEELVPVEAVVFDARGRAQLVTVSQDEWPRGDTTFEKLSSLRPAFDTKGSVTAGNSSPLTDGAAAVVLTSDDVARKSGARPLGYFLEFAVAGCDPGLMGMGPIPAVRKLLAITGVKMSDIDLVEINEAFAAQVLYCARTLEVPEDKLNVNGGAIALGHPLGVSGTRLVGTILLELGRRGGRLGIVTMCIGGGMGAAALVERA